MRIERFQEYSLIVRTAGSRKTKKEIQNDLQNTIGLEFIKEKAVESTAPILIHEEGDVIKIVLETFMIMIQNMFMLRVMMDIKKQIILKQFMPRNAKWLKI